MELIKVLTELNKHEGVVFVRRTVVHVSLLAIVLTGLMYLMTHNIWN